MTVRGTENVSIRPSCGPSSTRSRAIPIRRRRCRHPQVRQPHRGARLGARARSGGARRRRNLPLAVDVTERPPRARRLLGRAIRPSTGRALRAYWAHRNLFGGAERLRFDADLYYVDRDDIFRFDPRHRKKRDFDWSDLGGRFSASFLKPALWGTRNDLLVDGSGAREVTDTTPAAPSAAPSRSALPLQRHVLDPGRHRGRARPVERHHRARRLHPRRAAAFRHLRFHRQSCSIRPAACGSRPRVAPYPEIPRLRSRRSSCEGARAAPISPSTRRRATSSPAASASARSSVADLDEIPANRRFYAGGGGSVRGYEYQCLRPLGPFGEPIGGRSLLEGSIEARIKVTDTIGIVPFVDAGTAFESSHARFRRARSASRPDLGLRYYTGIGPIRLDVAVPARPPARATSRPRSTSASGRPSDAPAARLIVLAALARRVSRSPAAGSPSGARARPGRDDVLGDLISRALSTPTTRVSIGAVDGALSSDATIRNIAISRPRRRLAAARPGAADLAASGALSRAASKSTGSKSARLEFLRRPLPGEEAAAGSNEPILPELPVKIEVKAFSLAELALGEPVLGAAARLSASGSAKLGTPSEGLDLDARGAPPRRARPAFRPSSPSCRRANGSTQRSSSTSRPAASSPRLAGIPGLPPVRLDLAGQGRPRRLARQPRFRGRARYRRQRRGAPRPRQCRSAASPSTSRRASRACCPRPSPRSLPATTRLQRRRRASAMPARSCSTRSSSTSADRELSVPGPLSAGPDPRRHGTARARFRRTGSVTRAGAAEIGTLTSMARATGPLTDAARDRASSLPRRRAPPG